MEFVFRNPKWHRFIQGMMLVLLWPGPIPVAHSHASADVSAVEVTQLSRHLAACHGGFSPFQLSSLGWHVHWVVPSTGYTGINAEQLNLQSVRVVPLTDSDTEEDLSRSLGQVHDLLTASRTEEFTASKRCGDASLRLEPAFDRIFVATFSVVLRC